MYQRRGYGKEFREIMTLALPVVASQLGQILVQLVDNSMVGHLGAVELSSVSFAGTIMFLFLTVAMGVAMGLTPLVGEVYARNNYRLAASYMQNALVTYTAIGLIFTGLLFAFIPVMSYLGQPEEVVEMAIPYYIYISLSVIPFMLYSVFKQFLEAIGNTKVAMVIVIAVNCVHIFSNWLLIYGKWGFPEMGTTGAGISTLVSRSLMPLMIIAYFFYKDSFRRYFSFFSRSNFDWIRVKALFRVGLPISGQMLMEGSIFAVSSIMMGWIGTEAIAANQIVTVVANVAFMVIIGIGSAITICVSHSYGRKDFAQIRRYAVTGYRICLVWNTFTLLAIIGLRHYIPMFFTDDAGVLNLASYLLIFIALFQIFDGMQVISIGVLRGIQDVKIITLVAFVSYFLVGLSSGYLLAFWAGMESAGLWIGVIIGLALASTLLFIRYRRQMRRLGGMG